MYTRGEFLLQLSEARRAVDKHSMYRRREAIDQMAKRKLLPRGILASNDSDPVMTAVMFDQEIVSFAGLISANAVQELAWEYYEKSQR